MYHKTICTNRVFIFTAGNVLIFFFAKCMLHISTVTSSQWVCISKGFILQYRFHVVIMGTGIILCMRPANERWHYNVTSSVIGWVHTQNDPCGNSHDLEDFFSLQYKCLTDQWRLFFFYWGSSHWIISTSSVVIPIRKRPCLFSCDQAALRTLLSVRLSFCPSVRPSVTPFYPSALRAGGVLSSRFGRAGGRAAGRPGGRLPNLRNPYLCNRLTDFLHSKFWGIV